MKKDVPTARVFRVILPVSDISGAAAFYAAVFGKPGVRISPGRHYFGCGGVIVALFDPRADGDSWDATPNPDHIYLAVSDLDLFYQRVSGQSGDLIRQPIQTQPWGERSFYCTDPFGNKLCFVEERTLFTAGLI